MMTGYAGVGDDGFEYTTAVQETQRSALAPAQQGIDDVVSSGCLTLTNVCLPCLQDHVYLTNSAFNYPGQVTIAPSLFAQAPSTQTTNSGRGTSACFPDDELEKLPVPASAYISNPQYNIRFMPPMQSVGQVNSGGRTGAGPPPLPNTYTMNPPARPIPVSTSASANDKPPPCRGHPAPGWCWKCKWHHSSCTQIAHPENRYCFHCMRSRLWDGEERRD